MSAAEQPVEEVESDSSLSEEDEDEEYISVDLSEFKELKCAICLGIIRNTRTVTECLHRFCKECIEKSMRLGINECPICRVHVPSRRSLREDPNFDKLISALVPDIDKYEEQEELAFLEDRSHDKEMEDSSVENVPCETEASDKKEKARAIAVAFDRMRKSEGKRMRRHGNLRNAGEVEVSNENEALNDNNAGKDLCSDDEKTETGPRKDGERETQIPQECVTMDVDREISSTANLYKNNTVLSDEEKTKQEMSQNVIISEILTNGCTHIEVEKEHVGAANPQLKEEVMGLKEKLAIVEENFKTLKSVMLRYIEMKEGHIPSELITIFGDTTNVADKRSG